MSTSIFARLFGQKKNIDKGPEEASIDISRVIPDYVPVADQLVAAASEATAAQVEPQAESQQSLPDTEHLPLTEKAESAVDALAEQHDAWAQSDLNALNKAWASAREHGDMSGHLNEVRRIAHNLKGMAATYGHPAMSRLASSLCLLLESGRAHNQHALINLHVEACRAAYLEGKKTNGGDHVAQSVCVALETQVKRTINA